MVLMIKLQCPDHTFYIIGVHFPGTDRINIQKHLMQIFISLLQQAVPAPDGTASALPE